MKSACFGTIRRCAPSTWTAITVKQSTLPHAGLGVFATRPLRKFDTIPVLKYTGEVYERWADVPAEICDEYLLCIDGGGVTIDCARVRCVGSMINDPSLHSRTVLVTLLPHRLKCAP